MNKIIIRAQISIIIFFIFVFSGCGFYSNFTAYYNTFYNAKKEFEEGVKKHEESEQTGIRKTSAANSKYFNNAMDKCWKIIEFHGYNNKYSDDAVLMIIKCEYYLDKFTSAQNHVQAFNEKFPNSDLNAELNLWHGKCFLKERDTVTAEETFNKALVRANDSKVKANIYLEFAQINFHREKYDDAVNLYEKALKEADSKIQKAQIQYYLAESYYKSSQYEEAANTYKKVLKYAPSNEIEFSTQFNYSSSLLKLNQNKKALETLEKMLTASRFKKNYSKIYSLMGDIYQNENDLESAIYYYRKGLKLKKGEGSALCAYAMADLFEDTFNNVDSAVFYYKKVKQFHKNSELEKKATEKSVFLGQLGKIQNSVDQDALLIYKLENDFFFKDSLKDVQEKDSIYQINKSKKILPIKDVLQKLSIDDTTRLYYTENLKKISEDFKYDSVKITLKLDSLITAFDKDTLIYLDTIRYKKNDVITQAFFEFEREVKRFEKKDKENVERRKLPEIKADYKKHVIELGDFYLLETQLYDSAKVVFENFIEQYDDSLYSPKALYSLAYIYTNFYDNKEMSDQILAGLEERYPESHFARQISNTDQKEEKKINGDECKKIFLKAENLLFTDNIDSSITVFKSIITIADSASEWIPKSIYALAYIYEKNIQDADSALFYYTLLSEKHQSTEYGKKAKLKTSSISVATTKTIKKEEKEEEKKDIVSVYSDDEKERIKQNLNQIIGSNYIDIHNHGQIKRYWSKKQIREFLNQL